MLCAWLFLILSAGFAQAEAARAPNFAAACRALAKQDPVAADRCLAHVRSFETPPELIAACTAFHESLDVRFRCPKSGATPEVLRLCAASPWSLELKISCLRAYPTPETMRACQQMGGSDEQQVQCVRLGRDDAQVIGCNEMMPDAESRILCLQPNVPAYNARLCGAANKSIRGRIECLEAYAEARDRGENPAIPARGIASQPTRGARRP